ncbi:MAG TPA: lipopolysaccharide heptosyltransferase II [Vicinamibacteria bacterium]|nr:lipopolysaccharide heptosyltransferase II [Vicinamibacteria bacterium]
MKVDRIVARAPNWVGDAVLSLGAVRDLRRNFPAARLEVLARPWVAPLYEAVAEVDAVRLCRGFLGDRRALQGAFDAAVLLPNSFAAAATVWAAGIPERWGYATDGRGALLTRRARVPRQVRGRSQVYYYRAMLAGIGLVVSATPDVRLRAPEAWTRRAAALLGEGGAWIGLNPGAFFGSAKRWEPTRYAAAGERLARETGARIAIVGGARERPLGEAIAAAMSVPARVLCGETTLGELLGVLARLRLLLTNDSGPMHLAAALGVPVLAVFGPTDWRETGPVGERRRLVREPVHCSPCLLRECPIDHRCMRRVGVERVVGEARALLAEA